jgi:hypothetical protein
VVLVILLPSRRREGRRIQHRHYCHQHAFQICQNISIRKTQRLIALFPQIAIPAAIFFLPQVMRHPIEFDDQLFFAAQKICDIWPDGHLTTKFPAFQLAFGDRSPEHAFGRRRLTA